MISRRSFVATAGVATSLTTASSLAAAGPMPMRTLGRTGAKVSAIAFGGGSRFLMYKSEEEAEAVLLRALDLGITYFDNAFGYGDGRSETRYGRVLKPYRDKIWLVTKTNDRTYDGTMKLIEGSLQRLQTDRLDLIHIHALNGPDDLAAVESPDGVLKAMYKLREQKVTRAIGVSCHNDPEVLKTALERHDFDCTQMALNAARVGASGPKPTSFEAVALPVAVRKNLGIIAMKVFAQDKIVGKAPVEQLIRYSLSLPVATAVMGMPKVEMLDMNVAAVKQFQPLDPATRDRFFSGMAGEKASIDRYFADHLDC
jgi:aryl-alcohol dehydrogenase-like predicted oxidoreductase